VQFPSERTFEDAAEANGFSKSALRERISTELRGRRWVERQIGSAISVTEQECRQFYQAHQDLFTQPVRFRVSHIFLAAHAETPPDIVEEKELAIGALAQRLAKGEALPQLATEASEDEATKTRGGDLGFFSESRMPAEFMAEIKKLRVGQASQPFRTPLGFHIMQVTDLKVARLLTFEEARPEISVALANERRVLQAQQIAANLSASK
jgi:parvulin-like peptidyl-prolyl isomerase